MHEEDKYRRFRGIVDDERAAEQAVCAGSVVDAVRQVDDGLRKVIPDVEHCVKSHGLVLIGRGDMLIVQHVASGGEFRFQSDAVTVGKIGGRGLFLFNKRIIDNEQARTESVDEWVCAHGIGHGNHPHSCDGCCPDPADVLDGETTTPRVERDQTDVRMEQLRRLLEREEQNQTDRGRLLMEQIRRLCLLEQEGGD